MRPQHQSPHSWKPSTFWSSAILLLWGLFLTGCNAIGASATAPPPLELPPSPIQSQSFQEVAPPASLQAIAPSFDQYQPQVNILSPQPDEVQKKTTITVKVAVKDFPKSGPSAPLRPHLHVILDNEPYRAVYDPESPILLEDLKPGTHTLRIFPVRPWHESYKNIGAYAETTFHVLTKTDSNNPDPALPLLTYSRPKGDYGAEPILLDFYLRGAPLHQAALTEADVNDWRIRVTINDESFLLDQWQPIYLSGFRTGENWVKLEFIDEAGNLVANRYNNTVRVINVQPGGVDPFSRLMRGETSVAEAFEITGLPVPETLPEIVESPSVPSPDVTVQEISPLNREPAPAIEDIVPPPATDSGVDEAIDSNTLESHSTLEPLEPPTATDVTAEKTEASELVEESIQETEMTEIDEQPPTVTPDLAPDMSPAESVGVEE